MCSPAFLYPMARVSEEPGAMPIPDNAKGFPVIEDAFVKQARLRLMIGLMNQGQGTFGRFGSLPGQPNRNATRDTLNPGQGPAVGGGPAEGGQAQGGP